jgi:hypothetical protein
VRDLPRLRSSVASRRAILQDVHLIAQFGNPFQIVWNILAGALTLYAVVTTTRLPAPAFRHGRRTKIFWVLVAIGVLVAFGGYVVPIGSVSALYAVTAQEHRRKLVIEVGPSSPTPI